MSDASRHPDIFDVAAAIQYLWLDRVCPTPAAAAAALRRLVKKHGVKTLNWGKGILYPRASLEQIVAAELAPPTTDAAPAEGARVQTNEAQRPTTQDQPRARGGPVQTDVARGPVLAGHWATPEERERERWLVEECRLRREVAIDLVMSCTAERFEVLKNDWLGLRNRPRAPQWWREMVYEKSGDSELTTTGQRKRDRDHDRRVKQAQRAKAAGR
jgi:hypothetical protein